MKKKKKRRIPIIIQSIRLGAKPYYYGDRYSTSRDLEDKEHLILLLTHTYAYYLNPILEIFEDDEKLLV